MDTKQTARAKFTPGPFAPGTYGHSFYLYCLRQSADRLRQMDRANDAEMTYDADAEAARMVRSQAIAVALAKAVQS